MKLRIVLSLSLAATGALWAAIDQQKKSADAKTEELRETWFSATDAASSKKAADAVQARAFEFVPYVPTAQFILPTAYRSNLSGVIIAPMTLMWNVEKR